MFKSSVNFLNKSGQKLLSSKMSKVVKAIVTSPKIYKPVGPYSQAVVANNTLYVSGVLGCDVDTKLVAGGTGAQARKALENLRHVLEAGGSKMEAVVKTTILMANIEDFQEFNKVYAEFFPKNCPARAAYQVAKLPMNAAIEIEAIALVGDVVVEEFNANSHI
ncbi:rutC family protein UK114 [Aricia agestis]|uniref:rutC family protein UK114 n=1 Tax=Aricia agestis TaxID=91739 RepID=UPI001C206A10|nr:rutC family protein UK114 [Aricia agestis]